MRARSVSDWLGPTLLAIGLVLNVASWYRLAPRATWPAAVMLAVLALVWSVAFGIRRSTNQGAPRRAADALRQAVVFAALMLVLTSAAKLAVDLGMLDGADLSRRTGMAFLGLFIAFIGNTTPKTLTPLSRLRCDPGRVQAFQRLAGWTWVLAGFGYAIVWLVAPLDLAKPVSTLLVVAAILLILTQLIRLRRSRDSEA